LRSKSSFDCDIFHLGEKFLRIFSQIRSAIEDFPVSESGQVEVLPNDSDLVTFSQARLPERRPEEYASMTIAKRAEWRTLVGVLLFVFFLVTMAVAFTAEVGSPQ